MRTLKARAEALDRTDLELKSEMAAALGRISRTLTETIQDLNRLRQKIPGLPKGQRSQAISDYRRTHSRARQYYWYLMVQREAIGIRNHDLLRDLYPIPAKDLR